MSTNNHSDKVELLKDEVWRDIEGFVGYYQMSSRGRIRSLPRIIDNAGRATRKKGKISKTSLLSGSRSILLWKDGKPTSRKVSQLYIDCFPELVNKPRDFEDEIWKDIKYYEHIYQVSNKGRVKSLKRMKKIKNNRLQPVPERIRSPSINKGGYSIIQLWKDNLVVYCLVSRLVLETFIGPCPNDMECCHNDGDPSNNRLENLRWDTRSGNMSDRITHGTHNRGDRHPMAKLNEDQVKSIIARSNESSKTLAEEFGVTRDCINCIKRGACWKHIPRKRSHE